MCKELANKRFFREILTIQEEELRVKNERKDIKYYAQRNIRAENLIYFVNKETLKEQHRKQQRNKSSVIDKVTKE